MEIKNFKRRLHIYANKVCTQSVRETAEYLKNEAQKRASLDVDEVIYSGFKGHDNIKEFESYKNRFDVKEMESEKWTYKARAYNDFLVASWKHGVVPFGNYIEWGTGLTGLSTADGTWGSGDYTLKPWDERTYQQNIDMGTFGMAACPHWSVARERAREEMKNILATKLKENL